jgi:hypothetical protein
VNNVKDVSVEIPKDRLTVFTGISGSGKRSSAPDHRPRGHRKAVCAHLGRHDFDSFWWDARNFPTPRGFRWLVTAVK